MSRPSQAEHMLAVSQSDLRCPHCFARVVLDRDGLLLDEHRTITCHRSPTRKHQSESETDR